MTENRSPPAADITLLDVIKHMDNKFQQIDKRLDQAQTERADILHEMRTQANSCDNTLEEVADLKERVTIVEKQLTASNG